MPRPPQYGSRRDGSADIRAGRPLLFQLVAKDLVHRARIGLALGRLHDLADEPARRASRLPTALNCPTWLGLRRRSLRRPHGFDGTGVGHLLACRVLVDNRRRACSPVCPARSANTSLAMLARKSHRSPIRSISSPSCDRAESGDCRQPRGPSLLSMPEQFIDHPVGCHLRVALAISLRRSASKKSARSPCRPPDTLAS